MPEKLWEEVKKGIKETVSYVTEKTEELTTIGRLKMDIAGIKKQIEKKFAELGELLYQKIEKAEAESLTTDDRVQALVDEIADLEKQLKAKEAELEKVGQKSKETTKEEPPSVEPATDSTEE